jgi:hypothetical protein
MDDCQPTMAEESLRWLASDPRAALGRLRTATAHVPRLVADLDELGNGEGDHLAAGLAAMTDQLYPIMSDGQDAHARELGRLSLAGLDDEDAFAMFTRFDDGSSRVLISTALIGMLHMLAELTSIWYYSAPSRGWRDRFTTVRANAASIQEQDVILTLVAAVRWNAIHQRVWGKCATLALEQGGKDAPNFRDASVEGASTFVVAHECAHGLLGHSAQDAGDWEAETAADAQALRAVQGFLEAAGREAPLMYALLAARMTFMVTDLIEQVLFVRPPVRHPSARARWEAVVREAGSPSDAQRVEALTAGLGEAIRQASDLRSALPRASWDAAYANEHVRCDVHPPIYYDSFWVIDELNFGGPERPAQLLRKMADQHGVVAATAVAESRHRGLAAGLAMLGIDEQSAQLAARVDAPLSAHSLIQLVEESPVLSAIPQDWVRTMAAVSTVRLVVDWDILYPSQTDS